MTKNHGYNTPQQGTDNWHVPLNENFTRLDTDVEIRDSESNLGEYEPKAGAKFLATDTTVAYIGDGSTWQAIPTSGRNPKFETVQATRVNKQFALSTDTEFHELLSELNKNQSGRVYIELIDDIQFKTPPEIENLPHNSVINGGNGYDITFSHETNDPSLNFDGQSGIKLKDLRLHVPNSTGPIVYFNNSIWEPCKFEFDAVQFRNTGGGVSVAGNMMPWANIFKRCEFTGMADNGASVYVQIGGIHNQFYDCHFFEIDPAGVAVEPAGGPADEWLFHGCTFGGNRDFAGSGINCFNEETSVPMGSVNIIACSFEYLSDDAGADAYGVRAWGRTTIENCYFKDVTTGINVRYVSPGQGYETIVRQPQFESGITDYAIDAEGAGENHVFLTPLRDGWEIRDPGLNVYSRSLCRSGTIDLSEGAATVDTGVSSATATFDISASVQDPQASVSTSVLRDDSSGTHLVEFTQQSGSATSPRVTYRIIQRSP